MSRVIALDYGRKRIGVALSDENQVIAFARPYIPTEKKEEIIKLIDNQAVTEIVLGLPLNLEGRDSEFTKQVKTFARFLEKNTKAKLTLVDERLTSQEAARALREEHYKAREIKEIIDSLVAQKLLENYLKRTKQ